MLATIKQHSSPKYAPRTFHNATYADLTLAVAVDYTTAGEKLTEKAASGKYLAIHVGTDTLTAARQLYKEMRKLDAHVLNVAGNGIYTLAKHGLTQADLNRMLYEIIGKVHEYWRIGEVVSGGQTGVDIAGIVAAEALGIKSIATLPQGFLQRHENNIDVRHTLSEIQAQIKSGVNELLTPRPQSTTIST